MVKERLLKLFATQESNIQQIVGKVIDLEREYLSMKNPKGIKPEIDDFVTDIAKRAIQKPETTSTPE